MALTDTQAKNMKKKKSSFVDDYERRKAVRDLPSPSTGAELSTKSPIKTGVQTKANQPTVKKSSPATKKKAEQSREKGRTLQAERDQLNAKQTLSRADKDLSAADRLKVKDAKTAWDQAEAAGDAAGMQAAHKMAEAVRKRYGYSGGVAGDEYISPELTTQELSKLNTLGRQRLKAARMNLEAARKTGSEDAIAQAENVISRILELPAYRQAAYQNELTTGQGTPLQVRSRGDMLDAFNRTIAGGEAAAKGFAGSLLSLREISRDFVRENAQERWGGIQKGPAQSDGVTRALMDQETTGQRLMRESREAQQEATRGLSGVEALLANAGISSAQALPGIAASFIPGVGPALGLGLMGAQAAGSKANEMTERGYSAGEALARGLVSGGIEALTERLPIKNLVDIVKTSGGASFLVDVAKQAGLEAGEETASTVLNHVADLVNQDPEAELSLMELAEAAAVGAISGAGFGAVGSVIGGKVGEAPAVEEATPENSPWSTVSETFNRAVQAYKQRQAEKSQPTKTGQDILLEAAGIRKDTTQESPTTRQDSAEQTFERGQGDMLGETETPVRAIQEADRAIPAQESRESGEADRVEVADRIAAEIGEKTSYKDWRIYRSRDMQGEGATVTIRKKDGEKYSQRIPDGKYWTNQELNYLAAEMLAEIEGQAEARSVGSAAGGFDPYSRMMNEYGTHSPGENPARLVDVPISTDGQDRVSQFARNVMEAGNTTDATVERIQQMIVNRGFSYKPRKDREALVHAVKTIEEKGFTGAYRQWQDVVEGRRTAEKDDMVLAQTLYIEAEQAGDSQTSARLAAEIAAEATRMGQGLQALRLLKKTTKAGRAYYIRKTVENIRKEAANRTKKDVSGITVDEGLMQKFMEATTKEEEDAALDAVYLDVARKVPANWTDRANAWRYFAMLSNPRTHFRNVLGNVIWGGLLKGTNTVSTGLQALMLPAEKRTRAIKATPAAKEFAKQDYEAMKDVLSGGKYESSGSALERQIQRNALGPLSKVTNKVSDALEKEDSWAKKPAYIRSMARFITARGWNPATMTADQLELARNQAIKDAREATFTDASALASALSDFERTNTATRLLVGGVMPFKGVPINITKQAYNLSPFGLMTSTVDMLRKVKRGDETAAEAIDKFAKGLSGTSIAAVGAFLAAQGILNAGASDDEKERALDEASGSQAYSLDLSGIPFDKIEEVTGLPVGDFSIPYTYTIDWAAPSIIPLVIGAELYNVWTAKDEAENGEDADDSNRLRLVLEALSRSFDILAEMTTFSGLGSTLQSASYSENGFLPAVVGNVLGNYAGQFIPTPVGALARTIDNTRRSTYTDKDSPVPVGLQKFAQQQANKIPRLSQKSVPYMDVWGREDKQENLLLRALENFVSPGYGAKVEDAEATQEVERLGDLGYRNALLGVLSKGQKVDLDGDGKQERLSREQWEAWNRTRGEAALDLIGEVIGSDTYKALSDEEKAKTIERVYDYATLLGKEAAGADTSEFDGWFFGAKEAEEKVGMSAAKFIELYTQKGMIDSANKDLDKDIVQGLFESYVDGRTDLTDEQKAYTKENIKLFTMVPADSSAYNKAVEAGYTEPEEIQALHEERRNYDLDGDGNRNSKAEILHYISSTTDDPEEQEKKWNALKEKGETRTYAQLEKEYRAQVTAIQTAKTNLDEKVSAETQSAFAAAISDAGADSQKEIKKALRSVEATEDERIAYYELVKVKQGWKKSWGNIKA